MNKYIIIYYRCKSSSGPVGLQWFKPRKLCFFDSRPTVAPQNSRHLPKSGGHQNPCSEPTSLSKHKGWLFQITKLPISYDHKAAHKAIDKELKRPSRNSKPLGFDRQSGGASLCGTGISSPTHHVFLELGRNHQLKLAWFWPILSFGTFVRLSFPLHVATKMFWPPKEANMGISWSML